MDKQDRRWHEIALGAARFARRSPHWRLSLDPFPLDSPAGTYQGAITDRSDVARACIEAGMKAVCVSWHSFTIPVPRVVADHRRAGDLAANHLVGRGFRHVGFVGFSRDSHSRLQETGFRKAAHMRGASVHVAVLRGAYVRRRDSWARPRAALGRWLDGVPKPAGVFAFHDLFALHLAAACREKGLRVPDDVGIVGTGNDLSVCELAEPPLSSVDLNYLAVGERAAEYLEVLMSGGSRRWRNPRVTPSLVVRGSSDRWMEPDAAVTAALRHIAEHSHEAVRVADVAAAAGLSLGALERRFRAVRQATVVQEIARVRAERARDLLVTTGLSVAEVAARCGFGSAQRLALVFRRQEGLSPREWRGRAAESPEERRAGLRDVKALLVNTAMPLDEIAGRCGYRSARHLTAAFREAEYLTPWTYRSIFTPRPEEEPLPPLDGDIRITIRQDGEDEGPEPRGTSHEPKPET